MQCDQCGKHLRLQHKRIEIDTLVKFYECRNRHQTIVKHYGNNVEVNGEVTHVKEFYKPPANMPSL